MIESNSLPAIVTPAAVPYVDYVNGVPLLNEVYPGVNTVYTDYAAPLVPNTILENYDVHVMKLW